MSALSAGSSPEGQVHPLSLEYLAARGVPTMGLHSKSWEAQEIISARPDLVITVCDSAASETCPLWLGPAPKIHWALKDPSKLTGSKAQIQSEFERVMDEIERRVALLQTLAAKRLSGAELAVAAAQLTEV